LALCVLAAATFWVFNALNKNYATTVRLPLRFEFDGSRFREVEPLPTHVAVNLSGSGWRIIRNEYGIKVPDISISLERPADVRKMSAAALLPVIASQLQGLKLNYIVTDTLFIHIDPIVTRQVRVKVSADRISFRKNYGAIGAMQISPDTATITGAASLIASLGDTLVLHPCAEMLSANFEKAVSWSGPQESFLQIVPTSFLVHLPVDKIELISFSVALRTPRLPHGYSASTDSIKITWQIPASLHQNKAIDRQPVQAIIKLPAIAPGETRLVRPDLTGVPDGAILLHIDSVRISRNPK
jgi:hypothetical protein